MPYFRKSLPVRQDKGCKMRVPIFLIKIFIPNFTFYVVYSSEEARKHVDFV